MKSKMNNYFPITMAAHNRCLICFQTDYRYCFSKRVALRRSSIGCRLTETICVYYKFYGGIVFVFDLRTIRRLSIELISHLPIIRYPPVSSCIFLSKLNSLVSENRTNRMNKVILGGNLLNPHVRFDAVML